MTDLDQTWIRLTKPDRARAGARSGISESSRSLPDPCLTDLDRSLAQRGPKQDRTSPSRTELEPETATAAGAAHWQLKHTCNHADAGPVTELPVQTGSEPEPHAASLSRIKQEPTSSMPTGPGSEPNPTRAGAGQDVSESDGMEAQSCVGEAPDP